MKKKAMGKSSKLKQPSAPPAGQGKKSSGGGFPSESKKRGAMEKGKIK